MRRLLLLVAVVLAELFGVGLVGASGSGGSLHPDILEVASGAARPITLATVPGKVYAVAQSVRYVAWRACDAVEVRGVSGHRYPTIPVPQSPGFGCQVLLSANEGLIDHDILAILGGTVTWSKSGYGNSTDYAAFGAAQVTSGRGVPSVLPSNLWLSSQTGGAGSYIAGPVSDGRDLLYGVTRISNDPSCSEEQLSDFTCPLQSRGTLWRVDNQLRRHRVAAAAATLVAFSGGRVALVPHATGQPPDRGLTGRGFREPQPRVVLLKLTDGSPVGAVDVEGEPYELALSPSLGAVLVGERARNPQVHTTTPTRLQWFNPRHGGGTGSVLVAANAEALSIAGDRIIFRQGQRIFSYVPGDPKPTVVTRAAPSSTIVGPTLVGTRLLWAENMKQGGRLVSQIRTVTLPAR